jgi:hypothetical protein
MISVEPKRDQAPATASLVIAHCSRCAWSRSGDVYAEVAAAASVHQTVCPYRAMSRAKWV